MFLRQLYETLWELVHNGWKPDFARNATLWNICELALRGAVAATVCTRSFARG